MIKFFLTKAGNQAHYYQYLRPAVLDATFIVSTGRTGTKFFESFFKGIDKQLLAVHEPRPDLFDLSVERHRQGKTSLEIVDAIRKHRVPFLRSYCQQRVKKYVESNPFAAYLLPEVKKAFDKSRFVVITRQAETYIKSAMNKSPLDDGAFYFYDDNDRRQRLMATDFEGDVYRENWPNFSRKQRIAWHWNKCNTLLLDFIEANPTTTLHLKFEALFSKEVTLREESLKKLLNFMNIELTEQQFQERVALTNTKKNQTKSAVYEGLEAWSESEKEAFNNITKAVQKRIDGA